VPRGKVGYLRFPPQPGERIGAGERRQRCDPRDDRRGGQVDQQVAAGRQDLRIIAG